MKYFLINGNVTAYAADGSQDAFIAEDALPLTEAEAHAHLTPPPATLADCQPVSHAQMAAALVLAGWITEAEGEAWLDGVLPPAFMAAIEALPEDARMIARFQAKRPSTVEPTNPLIGALAALKGLGEPEVVNVFELATSFT